MPLLATASNAADSTATPSHLPRMYCQGATGLVIVCQICLSRCSAATVMTLNSTTRIAIRPNAPDVPYCRNDWIR